MMIQCTEMTFSCGNKQSNIEEVEIRVGGQKEGRRAKTQGCRKSRKIQGRTKNTRLGKRQIICGHLGGSVG